ncbi:hypothetical protein [Streptomyces caeruleatus]|uniref:Uncharacterized protein n=1 Tax=Streptomyces caeruleatus TaxID=661399 RepID=A0A117RK78_9ACTN|nr:hypothetical protein [Streptomyces caeruleatus]KUN95384.1 hypothetical protein AQJ67_35935 [Streptomyces caeruleatus]
MAQIKATHRQAASSPAIAAALAPTGHPHPLLAEQAREHPEPVTSMERAETAIRAALRDQLAGTTTNFHGASDQLAEVLIDEQARHLARPEVGGFPLEECRGYEAFSLAASAMSRALALSHDPKRTYQTLCILLAELAEEVGE